MTSHHSHDSGHHRSHDQHSGSLGLRSYDVPRLSIDDAEFDTIKLNKFHTIGNQTQELVP